MQKKTDLKKVKMIARALLMTEIHETEFSPAVVQGYLADIEGSYRYRIGNGGESDSFCYFLFYSSADYGRKNISVNIEKLFFSKYAIIYTRSE